VVAVLDASAVIAYLHREPGHEIVAPFMGSALVSSVNASEVLTVLLRHGLPVDVGNAVFKDLRVGVVPFTLDHATLAASIGADFPSAGLSLGDRGCLALASQVDAPVVTSDRAWAELDVGIEIVLIR
jgi:PIN domain nuclease of toxin-antitoxin system